MFFLIFVFAVFSPSVNHAGNTDRHTDQRTEGWCSPAVADVKGNVTINCTGVDPQAMKRLNELLDKKDVELSQRIKDAEEWAARYRELLARIEKQGDDSELSRKAEELIKTGKLEEAGKILDEIIAKQEKQVEKLANNHYTRGQVFLLEFKPVEALPHLKKAYEYKPDNFDFAHEYARLLQIQNQFKEAEPIYEKSIKIIRKLAKDNPEVYLPKVALTLNNLGILYAATNKLEEAEGAYSEALKTYRSLADKNPAAYLPDVAMTLHNLGFLCSLTNKETKKCLIYIEESIEIRRRFAKAQPARFNDDLSTSLITWCIILTTNKEIDKNKTKICSSLREAHDIAYSPALKEIAKKMIDQHCK